MLPYPRGYISAIFGKVGNFKISIVKLCLISGRTCTDGGCIAALSISGILILIALLYTLVKYCKIRKQRERDRLHEPDDAPKSAEIVSSTFNMEWNTCITTSTLILSCLQLYQMLFILLANQYAK
mgnify:CR=1 FL=1